jgi:tRNA(fMet)-specific endonuclease VapC
VTRYMLDTSIISDLIRNPQGRAAKRIAKVGEDKICTSIVVAAELRYGCAKSGSKRLIKAVEGLLGEIGVLPFDVPADAEYGAIRAELEAAGTPIGSNDLLIAAHACATGATIVTANADEFKRVRGLKVENWLA